ncbi:predicted protein [Botrytis cinerea T4]|uniref:Uncharacterized protein n=1 Tax=Botryotinia fuckeliana (strain T4) TaxID=999810 RepID=G2Y5S7_BOTF4|nr:predicted protein [Botrytis cinerea T4]
MTNVGRNDITEERLIPGSQSQTSENIYYHFRIPLYSIWIDKYIRNFANVSSSNKQEHKTHFQKSQQHNNTPSTKPSFILYGKKNAPQTTKYSHVFLPNSKKYSRKNKLAQEG